MRDGPTHLLTSLVHNGAYMLMLVYVLITPSQSLP